MNGISKCRHYQHSSWIMRKLGLTLGALSLCVLCASVVFSQDPEPPIRLEKKPRSKNEVPTEPGKSTPKPKLEESKLKSKEKDKEKDLIDPDMENLEEKIKETLARLNKNFREVDDRLKKPDPTDPTQIVQQEIAKDLDQLIEETKKQQEQQQQQRQQKKMSMSQKQKMNQQKQRQKNQQQMAQQQQQQQPDGNPNDPRGPGQSREGMSKVADLYKDVWGHLPETMRQEMNQYSREQFMSKYNELLKQYYATIAEKGRRQDK